MNAVKEFLGLGKRAQNLTPAGLTSMLMDTQRTKSGTRVGTQDMLTFAPLWGAITDIAQSVAKCPLYLFERVEAGRERAENHPAFMYFADYPNQEQDAVEFYSQLMFHKLLYHRAIVWIDKDNSGQILGLYNLLPDRTYRKPDGMYASEIAGNMETFFPSEILDIKSPQSPFLNCEFAKVARESIGVGLAAQDHSSKFLAADCQPGGILEIPATFQKQARDNIERGLRDKMNGNQFKTLVLGDGAKWHSVQIDAEKSQLNETRRYQANEICQWLNYPPARLFPDSGGYGSRTADYLEYKDSCIIPHLNAIAGQVGLKVLTEEEKRSRSHYFEHNTDKLYTMEPKTRAEVGKIEREAGFTNANEYRASKNQNAIENGDLYWQPNANHTVDSNSDEAVETARMVLREKAFEWVDKTLGKIAKESQRKTATRFCDWFDHYTPENYADYFEACQAVGLSGLSQDALRSEIWAGINAIMARTEANELSVAVTEFCEDLEPKLKGNFSNEKSTK